MNKARQVRRPVVVVSLIILAFATSRLAAYGAGVRFDARPLESYFQYADPSLLQDRLLETVFYLHAQPPLFNLMLGLTIFVIGLFKKVVLADNFAPFVTPAFEAAVAGRQRDFFLAWQGAVAFKFQLYYDFSG